MVPRQLRYDFFAAACRGKDRQGIVKQSSSHLLNKAITALTCSYNRKAS